MAKTDAVLDLERTLDDLLATLLRDCGGIRPYAVARMSRSDGRVDAEVPGSG